jgi:hypothetical protein
MKLLRLRTENFAGIKLADLEFGPGLTILYGPNELGKSTLVEAIRMALLLPHTSTYHEPYIGWTGGEDPVVELTFETAPQRIYRVRKQFGKSGSSVLRESKNGKDFDDIERGRKVDARIREILPWGIPEPGGTGGGKGLPASFLATALLPVQSEVSALLEQSLQADPTATGKERIAAALQAVGQDPQFTALLRDIQARRDSAYTDKGAKKTAKGSIFKAAAERVNETREEMERLQRTVNDSEGAELRLRDLNGRRSEAQEAAALAAERVIALEQQARQAKDLATASEAVRIANEEVLRIRKIAADVEAQERVVLSLIQKRIESERNLRSAQARLSDAQSALEAAEAQARAESADPALSDTVARQQLDLRRATADQAAKDAQSRIDAALAARKTADAVTAAEREFADQEAKGNAARQLAASAAAKEKAASDDLEACGRLERAMEALAAQKLKARLDAAQAERDASAKQRAAITVPQAAALAPMRALATELARARGALEVGLAVTVTPKFRLDLAVSKDGKPAESTSTTDPLEVQAASEMEVSIGGIATIQIRGGGREAQRKAQTLEDRWKYEVQPHLEAAGVADLDALAAKAALAHELDAAIRFKDSEIASLQSQFAPLAAALNHQSVEGAESVKPDDLRKRRQKAAKDLDAARAAVSQASTAQTLAEERSRTARTALDQATLARAAALAAFPEGLDAALAAARKSLADSIAEKQSAVAAMAELESTLEARKKRIESALGGARANVEKARTAANQAQTDLTAAVTGHASQDGRLLELRRLRDAENLPAAEARFHEATNRHALLPSPVRLVTDADVAAARLTAAAKQAELEALDLEIQRAHGALEQVGGAVARERLRDAREAFQLAERTEREIEVEYEAWKLLLEQMKEADAAQASNLGQALAPAIAGRFHELTQRRYQTVQLTAQLGTEGVVAAGAVRSTERISVGTREQLSTLYRLALAEYLQSAVVLDDQLVQSDDLRMSWFRELLSEKARSFQIIVFTCRAGDYLGDRTPADFDEGQFRAIDLNRAVRRR